MLKEGLSGGRKHQNRTSVMEKGDQKGSEPSKPRTLTLTLTLTVLDDAPSRPSPVGLFVFSSSHSLALASLIDRWNHHLRLGDLIMADRGSRIARGHPSIIDLVVPGRNRRKGCFTERLLAERRLLSDDDEQVNFRPPLPHVSPVV